MPNSELSATNNAGLEFLDDMARKLAYEQFHVGRFADVETLMKGVLIVNPKDTWSLAMYASALFKLDRKKEALDQIEKACAIEPASARFQQIRREILGQRG